MPLWKTIWYNCFQIVTVKAQTLDIPESAQTNEVHAKNVNACVLRLLIVLPLVSCIPIIDKYIYHDGFLCKFSFYIYKSIIKEYYFKESFLPNLKKQLKSLTIISILHKIKINITNLEIYGSGINCCNMNIF